MLIYAGTELLTQKNTNTKFTKTQKCNEDYRHESEKEETDRKTNRQNS